FRSNLGCPGHLYTRPGPNRDYAPALNPLQLGSAPRVEVEPLIHASAGAIAIWKLPGFFSPFDQWADALLGLPQCQTAPFRKPSPTPGRWSSQRTSAVAWLSHVGRTPEPSFRSSATT